jgi:hypothetical protein
MNLSNPIEIQVLWKNEDTCHLEELGISTTYIPETKPITFYSVDYVSTGIPQGLDYETGFLSSGGEEFATLTSYDNLLQLVGKAMKK